MCASLWQGIENKPLEEIISFVFVPAMLAVFGYVIMKWLVWDLADEVWDAGKELVVKNKGRETHVPLAEIVNLNYQGFVNPPRITLLLRQPCELGAEISFMAPMRILPYSMPPIAKNLIARIDVARTSAQA